MEKFRVGTVTAHRRSETASWSLYWRIDGTRYRRTINTPDRMIAEEVAEAVWRAVQSRDITAAEDALHAPITEQLTFSDILEAFEAHCPAVYRSDTTHQSRPIPYTSTDYRRLRGLAESDVERQQSNTSAVASGVGLLTDKVNYLNKDCSISQRSRANL